MGGPSGPGPGGGSFPRLSTPGCDSQLFAEETSRPGTCAPRSRAYAPTTYPGSPEGSANAPFCASCGEGRYTKDGKSSREATSPGATIWGTSTESGPDKGSVG